MRLRSVLIAGAIAAGSVAGFTQVTGSGSAGAVPKFTGSSTIGNSVITELNGNIGIGTTSPSDLLTLNGSQSPRLTIQSTWTGPTDVGINFTNIVGATNQPSSPMTGSIRSSWWGSGMIFTTPRDLVQNGFHFVAQGGTEAVHIDTSTAGMAVGASYASTTVQAPANGLIVKGNVGIGTTSPAAKLDVNGSVKLSGSGASMTYPDGTVQATAWNGTTCGGDYAESVDVSGDRKRYEAGDVLVIDADSPDKFLHSSEPYSRFVAGIYSTRPGLTGRREGRAKTGEEVPMAMLGIVPTKVSAENGAIRPGDLLVSSATEGYAMKGTDSTRMMGAVIGKAMGRLDKETGSIEVLVSLQ